MDNSGIFFYNEKTQTDTKKIHGGDIQWKIANAPSMNFFRVISCISLFKKIPFKDFFSNARI